MTRGSNEPAATPIQSSRRWLVLARNIGASLLGLALLWWLIPVISSSSWREIGAVFGAVSVQGMAGLVALWLAGLAAYTWVLTAALPGLGHRRALTLNMTGSFVSNLAPMGGALGIATNLKMTRAWGIRDSSFTAFTLVSNIWNLLGKLITPLLALLALVATDAVKVPGMRGICATAALLIALVIGALVAWLSNERGAEVVGRSCGRLVGRLPGRWSRGASGVPDSLRAVRHDTIDIVARGWHQMTLGMASYLVLQGLLMWACLTMVGAKLSVVAMLTGFAVERLGSMAVITPGGVGVGEAAVLTVLVAFGAPPAETAAGLLLFRFFTYLIEIPVGGLWLGGWLLGQRDREATTP